MALLGKPPKDLVITDNPKDFEMWVESFQNYLLVVEISTTLDSNQRHALLLNCIGDDCVKIIAGLHYDKSTKPYENLIEALKAYFIPKANLTFERYAFRCLKQTDKVMPFINELHSVAKKCDFENSKVDTVYNQNVRDQLILGIKSDDLRKKLLSSNELTLDKAVHLCLAHESSAAKVEEIKSNDKTHEKSNVLNLRSRSISPAPRAYSSGRQRAVRFSSPNHTERNRVRCHYCSKLGHIEKHCFKKKRDMDDRDDRSNPTSQRSLNALFNLSSKEKNDSLKRLECSFFDCDFHALVDSGAAISVLNASFVKDNGLSQAMKPASHQAVTANGDVIEFKHCISGPLSIGDEVFEMTFLIAPRLQETCILGMDLLSTFRSIQFNEEGRDLLCSMTPSLISEFSDVFDREIKDSCCTLPPVPIIDLPQDTSPHRAKVRKLSPRDERICKEQVEFLLSQGIIQESRSEWRHAPVIVPKRSGGYRLAIDYRPVNFKTKLDAFPVPNAHELLRGLHGCKVFSVLDFTQFYYQIPLSENDFEKTAFFACGGLYEFRRCPFGLKNAVGLCSRIMRQIFSDVVGVSIYLDDLLIHAESREEHDRVLRTVLTRIREHNLTLNMRKCHFYQDSVSFLGHRVSDGKIAPDPDRIDSILHFPKPTTSKQLERFLDMMNYFRNYIPHFSNLTKRLYEMAKATNINWDVESNKSFDELKEKLASSILVLPSPDEEMTVHTDASGECVGACLVNSSNQPVAFVSKKLTETEKRWSTIDKESFAIIWSLQKMRSLLLGRRFTVLSDHQPLRYLFQAKEVSAKVSRWRISLADFDFEVKYTKGSDNVVADSLSRMYSLAEVDEEIEISSSDEEIVYHQKRDEELRRIVQFIERDQVSRPSNVSNEIWGLHRKLNIRDGLLYYEDKVFVPGSLRNKILTSAHYGHQGNLGMYEKINKNYFWPKLRKDVGEFIAHCRVCSLVKPKYVNPHLKPYLLDSPMQLVATDYIGPLPTSHGYRYLLVIIDAFSRFPEVYPVRDMGTSTLIDCFREYFSRYGFPDALLSDRGTQFQSREFMNYLDNFGVKKLSTTAYRPSSNGICERFNGSLQLKLKSLLTELELPRNQWTKVVPTALMALRNDKHNTTGFTPAELFFAFRVKDLSLPPLSERYLSPEHFGEAAENIARNRCKVSRRHEDRQFPSGSTVVLKKPSHGKLELSGSEATVVRQMDSHVVEVDTGDRQMRVSTARLSPVPEPRTSGVDYRRGLPRPHTPPRGPAVPCTPPRTGLQWSDPVVPTSAGPQQRSCTEEARIRPSRTRRPPSYLDDYVTDASEEWGEL